MGAAYRVAVGFVAVAASTGLGVGLWAAIAPDEQRRKEMAREFPRSSPEQQTEIRRQNSLVMAVIKEAAETNENVTQKQWPWGK